MKSKLLLLILLLTTPAFCSPETGTASYYSDNLSGHLMANGKPYTPSNLTCASWYYPLGTKLEVTCGDKTVIVTVTDRGPNKRLHRLIDLSAKAFSTLADKRSGLITVSIKPLS